jgi:hypothetical protein
VCTACSFSFDFSRSGVLSVLVVVILVIFLAHSFVSLVLLEYFFSVFGSGTLVLVLAASHFGLCSDLVWPPLDSILA